MFDDLLAANDAYVDGFALGGIPARAAKRLGVLTCIDSRIEPLAMLGLSPGDAKIVRNAGARVTDDVLRTFAIATTLLGVERIAVVQHTDCAMAATTEADLAARLVEAHGPVPIPWELLAMPAPAAALAGDLDRLRACPLISDSVTIAGFVYDVGTGRLRDA